MGDSGDASTTSIPWAAVFDPAANARVLTAIQARGFRAASEVISRFVNSEVSRQVAPNLTQPNENFSAAPGDTYAPPDTDRFLSFWEPIALRFLEIFHPSPDVAQPTATPAANVDVERGKASGAIAFGVDRPGRAAAEVWLHNSGYDAIADVTLRCTDLLAPDGSSIPSHNIQIAANGIDMPGRCSRGIAVSVDVTAELPVGLYRGTAFVANLPDLWIPIALTVR
jgi:hypothetical protein